MPEADFWVIPIIQGFVQVEELVVNYNETSDEDRSSPDTPPQEVTCVDDIHPRFTVALISRRSRHRAGRTVSRHRPQRKLIPIHIYQIRVISQHDMNWVCTIELFSVKTRPHLWYK